MKLADAARYFDKLPVADAYTGVQAMLGQLDLYDDTQRDGLTAVRRILSVAPGLDMPARHAVTLGSDSFIVSHLPAFDYFHASPIRCKSILHRADGLAEVKTVLQELTSTAGTSAYAAKVWQKGMKEVNESSDVTNHLTIYLAKDEPAVVGGLISLGGVWYMVRLVYETASGFLAAEVDQLDAPNFETVTYNARTYDPVTDAYAATPATVKVLRLRWQSGFEYLSPAASKYADGDDVVMVAAAAVASPTTQDTVTLSDGARRVDDVYAMGSVWHLKVRRP